MPSDFNRVHRLSRHGEVRGEIPLRPVALSAQNSKPILHLAGNGCGGWASVLSPANCSVMEFPIRRCFCRAVERARTSRQKGRNPTLSPLRIET